MRGTPTTTDREAFLKARNELMSAFASTPYRPTGLATDDQGLASVVQLLEWCTTLIADATDGHLSLDRAPRHATASCSPRSPRCSGRPVTYWPARTGPRHCPMSARWSGGGKPVSPATGRWTRTATMTRWKSSRGAPFTPRRSPSPSVPWPGCVDRDRPRRSRDHRRAAARLVWSPVAGNDPRTAGRRAVRRGPRHGQACQRAFGLVPEQLARVAGPGLFGWWM